MLPPFLVNAFLIAVLYGIYAPSLPFEVRCESGIYNVRVVLIIESVIDKR